MKLDDGFFRHPRMVAAGREGRALFLAGLCYCAANLTDGRIDKAAVRLVASDAEVRPSVASRLVDVGAWDDCGDVYEVHDYLDYNPSRDKVKAGREAGLERAKRSRETRAKQKAKRGRSNAGASRDPSPVIETPNGVSGADNLETQPPARRVAIQHWNAADPKPVLSGGFIALVKLCERFLDAGHTEPEVLAALGRTRAYTLDSIEFSLNEGRKGKPNGVESSHANIAKALLS